MTGYFNVGEYGCPSGILQVPIGSGTDSIVTFTGPSDPEPDTTDEPIVVDAGTEDDGPCK